MAGDDPEIAFIASVYKVQTLADGGIRISLDLPEHAITQAALLMECQRQGLALQVTCKTEAIRDGKMGSRSKRKSRRTAKEE